MTTGNARTYDKMPGDKDGPSGAGNTDPGLTPTSDITRKGLGMKPTQNQPTQGAPSSVCPACGNNAALALAVDNGLAVDGRISGYSCGTHLWIVQWEARQ